MGKRLHIPFLAKQKANAWQLGVLPCVFGILFYYAVQPAFSGTSFIWQAGSAALLGGAVALLGCLLTGGLRACALGLNLFLVFMSAGALYLQYQAQRAADFPGGWLPVFYYDKPMAVLAAAMSAYALVCLLRLLLPIQACTAHAQENFRSFFRIAGLGIVLLLCLVLFYGFFLVRWNQAGERSVNWVPFRIFSDGTAAYQQNFMIFGNIFLFFPLGFFLRGLFQRKTWLSIVLCAGFSLVMELCQWIFAIGQADIDDLLMNTLGGVLGVMTVLLLGLLRRKITKGQEDSRFLAWAS